MSSKLERSNERGNDVKLLKDVKLCMDLDYLLTGRGFRKVENIIQVILGRLLFWITFMFILGILITEYIHGSGFEIIFNPSNLLGLFFWSLAFLFAYSLYLLRNRIFFLDKPRTKNLHKLRDALAKRVRKKIELTNYINHNVLWILDYILNTESDNYLEVFANKMLKLSKVKILLDRLGIDISQLKRDHLRAISQQYAKTSVIKELIDKSFLYAFRNNLKYVDEQAFFLVFLSKFFQEDLRKNSVANKDLGGIELWLRNEALRTRYIELWKDRISIKPKSTVNRAYTSRYTPILNGFSRDFTNDVIQGEFVVSLARERELNHMVNLLEKGKKSAVLVVGEPGVGKTTLIKSLAVRMVIEDVPKKLKDKRLVGFDFNKAFSSSKNIESFKKKLRSVFDEVAQAKNVVLVLDNFNQLLNLRQELAGEIANIIIDSFDSNDFRLIATTDRSQFIRFIRPNRALAGMFSQVEMPVPSDEVAMQIVIDEVSKIESEYNVKISYSAVKASIELSHKFAYDRVLPDKAIDILKEAVVNFKHLSGKRPLEYDEVAKVISSKVGVKLGSITQDESEKLANLEQQMHKRIIDQNEAVQAVCGALRRARSGLSEAGKPIASFLFFGPTGVGKTEVAKTVADVYFGSEDRMVRIDMSEYQEEENLDRLIGFTSEKGAFEGGFLTEPVHKNPFSLVLLDEIDKANSKVLDLFLQVLDEGYVNDGIGRKIDFSNTIIIATSNAGSSVIADLLGKGENYNKVLENALKELKKVFRIEFLNRFDKIIMFKPLSPKEVKLIARKFVEQVRLKLLDKGIKLIYDDKLLARLSKIGYNPIFGAREMRRVVQEEVENKVAEMIVKGEVKSGGEVRL